MYFTGISDEAGGPIERQIAAHQELGWSSLELRGIDSVNLTAIDDDIFDHVFRSVEEAGMKVCCFASQLANWGRPINNDFQADLDLGPSVTGGMVLGTVSIAGLWDQADITVGGWDARTGLSVTSLKAGRVGNVNVTAPGGIGLIATSEWQSGLISAGWVGSISTTASRPLGTNGDFGASLTLTGADVPARTATLRAATIAGDLLSGSDWQIEAGWVTAINVAGFVGDGSFRVAGVDSRGSSLGTVRFGYVSQGTVWALGGVGAISTEQWDCGSVTAGWVGTVSTMANSMWGVPGDFGANMTLTGANVPARAATLGSATIRGDLAGSDWDIQGGYVNVMAVRGTVYHGTICSAGDINSLTIGASEGSDFGAGLGFDLLQSARHVASGDTANAPTGTIKTFAVKGWRILAGQPIPRFFSDSSISAKVGNVSLLNWDGLGGLFAPAGGIKSVKHAETADKLNCWVWPPPLRQVSDGPDGFIHLI